MIILLVVLDITGLQMIISYLGLKISNMKVGVLDRQYKELALLQVTMLLHRDFITVRLIGD